MKKIILAVLLILSSNTFASAISVEGAYVRHMPPTQPNSGAFMVFKNSGDIDRAAVSAESDVAETVELHTHIHDNGVMRMRQVEKIDIPAGGETELKPGGFHVMLIGLKQPLELGQVVEIKMNFDDGSSELIKAEVKSVMGGMMKENMQGTMDHNKMKGSMDHNNMKDTMENMAN